MTFLTFQNIYGRTLALEAKVKYSASVAQGTNPVPTTALNPMDAEDAADMVDMVGVIMQIGITTTTTVVVVVKDVDIDVDMEGVTVDTDVTTMDTTRGWMK